MKWFCLLFFLLHSIPLLGGEKYRYITDPVEIKKISQEYDQGDLERRLQNATSATERERIRTRYAQYLRRKEDAGLLTQIANARNAACAVWIVVLLSIALFTGWWLGRLICNVFEIHRGQGVVCGILCDIISCFLYTLILYRSELTRSFTGYLTAHEVWYMSPFFLISIGLVPYFIGCAIGTPKSNAVKQQTQPTCQITSTTPPNFNAFEAAEKRRQREAEERRRKAREQYEQQKHQQQKKEDDIDRWCQVLGLDRDDLTRERIEWAYKKLVKMCHPDKVSETEREQAHQWFKKVQEAYDGLKKSL